MVHFLRFCTKYDAWFSKYHIELIVVLSTTNSTYTVRKNVNPFLNKPWFLHVCSTSLWKHWEKEKLVVTCHFSFSHIGELSAIFIKLEIVICKPFQFGRVYNFVWKRLIFAEDNCTGSFNPFPNDKFQTLPNWKTLQMTISNFDNNGWKFSKQVENTVGKGEIACYEQFLLFPQCFQKTCTTDT